MKRKFLPTLCNKSKLGGSILEEPWQTHGKLRQMHETLANKKTAANARTLNCDKLYENEKVS
jgi:hypothetical protein